MKKITMKDIAQKANVSVATVSYILNHVTNQSIPAETRDRVLHIAKSLNYTPNLAARSLVKQKTGLIGILINKTDHESFWRKLRHYEFISNLEKLLTNNGYHVVLFSIDASNPKLEIISERKLDGVFLIDVKKNQFYNISNKFPEGVPLVLLDSIIDDPLFYKIIPDFKGAITKAKEHFSSNDVFLIMEKYNNQEIEEEVRKISQLYGIDLFIVDDENSLLTFLKNNQDKKGIILGEFLGILVAKHFDMKDFVVICTSNSFDILPVHTATVNFKSSASSAAFHLMTDLLTNKEYSQEKYLIIEAD